MPVHKQPCPVGTTLVLKQKELLDLWLEQERLAQECYSLYSQLNERDKEFDFAKAKFWRAIERLEPRYDGRERWSVVRKDSKPERDDGEPYLTVERVPDKDEEFEKKLMSFYKYMEQTGNGRQAVADSKHRPGHYI